MSILGDVRKLHKLNAFVQLIPLFEQGTAYCISILADLAQCTGQGVTGVLHSWRFVFANSGVVMNRNFKAPIDLIPGGVNPGIFLLVIEQEDDSHAHLFHCKQQAKLYWSKLVYPMNHDAVKGLFLCNANGSFTALYFLRCSFTFFNFLLCDGNHDFFELFAGRGLREPEESALLCLL